MERLVQAADVDARAAQQLLGYRCAGDALIDPRGRIVRCTPHRRTVRQTCGEAVVFRKLRDRDPGVALHEWRMLGRLTDAGFRVPRPVFFARSGSKTAIGMFHVESGNQLAGESTPVDRLLHQAGRGDGGLNASRAKHLATQVGTTVRRLHARGYCYRDLYWNHLYAGSLDDPEFAWIDVERAFRPAWRVRRWRVKDLAGLIASWPASCPVPDNFWDQFFAAYGDRDRAFERQVQHKAERILGREPRFGAC